mmetsp:Transcript_112957/g.224888  ORF Transcript_112957/g.224888 Transcript_112957/m.224888 type:complete len:512 (-) Transcript_112957:107-1642(-)
MGCILPKNELIQKPIEANGSAAKYVQAGPLQLQPKIDHRVANAPPVLIPKVTVNSQDTVLKVIERIERGFLQITTEKGRALEIQVNFVWTEKGILNPQDLVAEHFKFGDVIWCYGDVVPARKRSADPAPKDNKIPVLIMTGFLGAGKTTLLNYLLQEQREKKIAVIENEFGEVSIDDELLQQNKLALAEKIIVMDNGCVCCTIRDDLNEGLQQILDMTYKGHAIHLICVETTGMADPVPIVKTFMSSEKLRKELRLDGILTVADARNLPGRLDDPVEGGKVNEAYQQIAFADKIILNKLDLIKPLDAIAIKDRIRSINKFAKILPAVKGRVSPSELGNIRGHDVSALSEMDFEKEAETNAAFSVGHGGHGAGGHGQGHGHGNDHDDGSGHGNSAINHHGLAHVHGGQNRHDTRVNSFAVVREGEMNEDKLGPWFQSLFEFPPHRGTIFRIKGILSVKGYQNKRVFHAVMDAHDGDWAGPWKPGEKKVSKIVFIGKALDQAYLRKGFNDCFE